MFKFISCKVTCQQFKTPGVRSIKNIHKNND
uniref:Uncharacterized protein n=1 Tax=Anguilla anguilla TaxID=7936 RepID=A0A0E9SBC2_ANGAN